MVGLQVRCLRPLLLTISVLAIATTAIAASPPAVAATLTGKVVSIADGDTLTLLVDCAGQPIFAPAGPRRNSHAHPRLS